MSGGSVIANENGSNIIKKEITATYDVLPIDDVILATGTFTVNLFDSSIAIKLVHIKCISGGITIDGFSSQTIDGQLTYQLTPQQSVTLASIPGGWAIL